MRVMVFTTAIFLAAASIVFAAEPNGMTAIRLVAYRMDPGALGIVPLQSQMKADLADAGTDGPWPKLARYLETGDRADLPDPPTPTSGISDIKGLGFVNKAGGTTPFALPVGGPVNQAILGVGYSTLSEIGEHPIFMTYPEVQYYLKDVFDRLDRAGPTEVDRDALAKMRTLMIGVRAKDVTHELEQKIEAVGAHLLKSTPPRPFFVGALTEQCAYNAFLLHDQKIDAAIRGYLSSGQDAWDLNTPDGGSWRKELGSIRTGDWNSSYQSCRAFVLTLLVTPKAR